MSATVGDGEPPRRAEGGEEARAKARVKKMRFVAPRRRTRAPWENRRAGGRTPAGLRRGFVFMFASPRTYHRRPLAPPAVVVVSARAPRALNGVPHRRSRDRAHAPVDFALLVESPLLVLVDAPVDGGLHRRTGERARDAERGHADGSRRAPVRCERETRASPRAAECAWRRSRYVVYFARPRDRCRLSTEGPNEPPFLDR